MLCCRHWNHSQWISDNHAFIKYMDITKLLNCVKIFSLVHLHVWSVTTCMFCHRWHWNCQVSDFCWWVSMKANCCAALEFVVLGFHLDLGLYMGLDMPDQLHACTVHLELFILQFNYWWSVQRAIFCLFVPSPLPFWAFSLETVSYQHLYNCRAVLTKIACQIFFHVTFSLNTLSSIVDHSETFYLWLGFNDCS